MLRDANCLTDLEGLTEGHSCYPSSWKAESDTKLNLRNVFSGCDTTFFFFFLIFYFIYYLFICSWLCWVFVSVRGLSLVAASGGHSSSQCAGLSCCRAQAPDAQAQQLWLTGPAAPRHVGSSQTRARTRVPCIGRQTLNHCATREALILLSSSFK